MRLLLKVTISVVLVGTATCLSAQDGIYHYFDNITEKDGLSNNNITCFHEDKKGFMWIGTQNGLNRYDGQRIKTYTPAAGKQQYLSGGFITAIDSDHNGNVWVTTRKGLNRIDKVSDTTEVFLPDKNDPEKGLPNDLLWDVLVQNDTSVWMAADARDLSCYNPRTRQFTRYGYLGFIHTQGYRSQEKYHSIFRLALKSDHALWLATTDGILSFDILTGTFMMHYNAYFDHFTYFRVDTGQRSILFVEEMDRLCRYDYANNRFTTTPLWELPAGEAAMQQDKMGYWVPGAHGIAAVNRTGAGRYLISHTNSNNNLLPGKVNALFTSSHGIVWAGTETGISKYLPPQQAPVLYKLEGVHMPGRDYALNNLCYAGSPGMLYITAPAINRIYRVDTNFSLSVLPRPLAYAKDTCYGLYYDQADTLFLLCRNKVLQYSRRSRHWSHVSLPAAVAGKTTTVMQKDAAGNYWIGTRRNGLWVYRVQEKKWWQPSDADGFYGNLIYSMLFDAPFNTMWIGTFDHGLARYDGQHKTFSRYSVNLGNSGQLQSALINDLAADGKGRLWVATTEGGLSVFNYANPPGREFTTLGVKQGLPGENIYSVSVDARSHVWFSSFRGMGITDTSGRLIKLYDKRAVFSSPDFFNKMVLSDSLVCTSYDNMILFFHQRLAAAHDSVLLWADKITVNDTLYLDADRDTLRRLSYRENTLAFTFTAPHYVNNEPLYYRYKLEGLDADWIEAGTANEVRYASLSPGHYVFRVMATDGQGMLRSRELSFPFTIRPPFWYRWWFIALCSGCAIAAGIYWQKQREKKIRRRAHEKNAIEKQLAELEVKALRSQMNPHFIFNSLNSISMLVASHQNEKGLEYLSKFSRLLRIVLEESENNFVSLKDEIRMLDLYLQMERLRFGDSFYYTITVDDDLDEEDILLPAMLVHPLAENAVWHGLLHKEGARRLIIHFRRMNGNCLQCTVKDNGIGLAASDRMQTKTVAMSSIGRTSKGLQLVRDRLALLENQYGVQTAFSLAEVHDENGLLSGTKAIIEIPVVYEP